MRTISLDLESYGAAEKDHLNRPLPEQTVFSPEHSLAVDRPSTLILCASVTLCTGPHHAPQDTRVFLTHLPAHRRWLLDWLSWADTLIGHNITFDIRYLRDFDPHLRAALSGRHLLLDTTVLNFLLNEATSERSLKDLGPAFALFSYDRTLTHQRFKSTLDPALHDYVARDSWNTALLARTLSAQILADWPHPCSTSSSSPSSPTSSSAPSSSPSSPSSIGAAKLAQIPYYSDLLWSLIRAAESGVPMSRPALLSLESSSYRTWRSRSARVARTHALHLSGKGRDTSRTAFLERALDHLSAHHKDHCTRLLGEPIPYMYLGRIPDSYTKSGKLSTNVRVKQLARALLKDLPDPHSRSLHAALSDWMAADAANTLLSRYTYPLLRSRRTGRGNAKSAFDSILLPHPHCAPDIQLAHPTWYAVPTFTKDEEGGAGGQKQGRPSAQKPGVTQFPPPVKSCVRSRYRNGTIFGNDLAQIELVVPTLASGEPTLLSIYCTTGTPGDVHAQRTVSLLGPDIVHDPHWKSGDVTLDPRQWGKRINFADLYLATALTMQMTILADGGILLPFQLFHDAVSSRPTLRPTLYAWQQDLIARATADGFLALPVTGHTRYFAPGPRGVNENEIVNFPVQYMAALTMNAIQIELHKRLPSLSSRNPPAHFILNWYDAAYVDCSPQLAKDFPALYASCVSHVATRGYWSRLCDHFGRSVPLRHETKPLEH